MGARPYRANRFHAHATLNSDHMRRKLTDERKAIFLEHLGTYGIVGLACEAASPGCGPNRSRTTFYEARGRDPEFAAEWDAALERAEDLILQEMYRRGVTGVTEDVYGSMGQGMGTGVVGQKQVYSDKLLELYSRVKSSRVQMALNSKQIELSGKVTTETKVELGGLSPEKQALLAELLGEDEQESSEEES